MKKNYLISIVLVLLIILATKTEFYKKNVLGINPLKNEYKIDTLSLDTNKKVIPSIKSSDSNSKINDSSNVSDLNNKFSNVDSVSTNKSALDNLDSAKIDTANIIKKEVKKIKIEKNGLIVVFSNKGAVIDSVTYSKYFDNKKNPLIIFSKKSIDNISFSKKKFSDYIFDTKYDSNSGKIVFSYKDKFVSILKTYEFDSLNYMLNVSLKIDSKKSFSKIAFSWDSPINVNDYRDRSYLSLFSFINDETDQNKKNAIVPFNSTSPYWFGLRSKYFFGGYIFSGTKLQDGDINFKYNYEKKKNLFDGGFKTVYNFSDDKNKLDVNYKISILPIDKTILSHYPYNLKKAAKFTYGWIQWLSDIILFISIFLFTYLKNWGLVIIVVSVAIKLLLYPLNKKTIESQKKMSKVQPLLKEIQRKYKSNPQLMQKETMSLYKKHGVNPLGGCLPMLLQTPIFFGMYGAFRGAIQFRHAHFFGWITDLSQPEILFTIGPVKIGLLVTLSALTTFYTMKRQMTDPKQKAMPYIMAVFLFFIFSNMSAGLNLYWATFNFVQLAQELLTKKK